MITLPVSKSFLSRKFKWGSLQELLITLCNSFVGFWKLIRLFIIPYFDKHQTQSSWHYPVPYSLDILALQTSWHYSNQFRHQLKILYFPYLGLLIDNLNNYIYRLLNFYGKTFFIFFFIFFFLR